MAAALQQDWLDHIPTEYCKLPLNALKAFTVHRIGLYLDQELAVLDNNAGTMRDYRGLADLVGFDYLEIDKFESVQDKGKSVLRGWMQHTMYELEPATIGKLIEFLSIMERDDILTDMLVTNKYFEKDASAFLARRERLRPPIQDPQVSSVSDEPDQPSRITVEDVMSGRITKYDAFICFHPGPDGSEDTSFVQELINKLESPPYNFKLFVPYRNDLAGLNSHDISARIISERCRHMIVVLSNNFLRSKACDFQISFAHALSPGARHKRMVPVKLEEVNIPNIMRIMAMCDFTKRDLRDWSWQRLIQSIRVPLSQSDFQLQSSNPASLDSSMLPIESLWSRQSVPGPSGNTVNVSPGNTVNVSPGNPVNVQPGNAGFGETDLPSFADSAIGTGSVPQNSQGSRMAHSELPRDQIKYPTTPILSSALDSSSSTESINIKASTSVVKNKNSSSRIVKSFQKVFSRKKEPKAEEDMETGL